MIEIFLMMLAIMLAKRKGRKGRFRRYLRGGIDEVLSLTTLAATTLVLVAFDETVNERTFVSSIVVNASLSDLTPAAGVGPFMVGVAHSDYSAAEIEEWIEQAASWNEGDLVGTREIGKRLCRRIGIFDEKALAATESSTLFTSARKVKLGWILNQAQGLDLWVYNMGVSPVATTVPQVRLQGHANLWPT